MYLHPLGALGARDYTVLGRSLLRRRSLGLSAGLAPVDHREALLLEAYPLVDVLEEGLGPGLRAVLGDFEGDKFTGALGVQDHAGPGHAHLVPPAQVRYYDTLGGDVNLI